MRKLTIAQAALALAALALAGGCAKNIPPPEMKVSADEATVAKGRYLAGTMGCIACHSKRDWTRYAGPLVEGSELGGSGELGVEEGLGPKFELYAPNLTPHHLGAWSDGEVVRATVLGQSKDGRGLFPLMPYFEWRDRVAKDDMAAVVAYLRTVPAIERDTPLPRLPMPGFVVNGFPEPRALRERAPALGESDYGEYVTYRSGCMGCHTQADKRGNYTGPAFSGGRGFPVPAPGAGRVYSSNLTPDDDTGLGRWTREQFIQRFKAESLETARARPVQPGSFNSVMPWWAFAELTETDLGAMYDYLRTLPPTQNAVVKYEPTAPSTR